MIAILQEDLPYIVLTYDPYLEAYNSDALGDVERLCPGRDGRRRSASRSPTSRSLSLEPGPGASRSATTAGLPGGVAAIGAVVIAIAAFLFGRARGRREIEPLELEA